MEDKQLNFNQPLLSVRRFSAPTLSSEADNKRKIARSLPKRPPLPAYKSELKSGPVRHPGTVPFLWEKIPGRPKDESKSNNPALERPLVAPKLPPGRVLKVKEQVLDKVSKGTTAVQSLSGNAVSEPRNKSNLDRKNANQNESSQEGMEDKGITSPEDADETYLNALDTLSRTETAYMNCSVSGLSGLDGPDIIPSGTFSTDPQTRDFMMGRFLPAAKAMASETPQYAPRKQLLTREQPVSIEEPRRVRKVGTGDKRHQLRPNSVPLYVRDIAGDVSEDEGTRMPVQAPLSSVCRVDTKSSYAGCYTEAKKEHARSGVYRKRIMHGEPESGLREDNFDLKRESNQITNRSNSRKLNGSLANRHLQGSGISSYRSECSQSILRDEKGFLGIPEKAKSSKEPSSDRYRKGYNFLELLASENAEWEVGSVSSVVEKTLYVDSVQMVKSPNSNSCYADIKSIIEYRGNDLKNPEKCGEMEENPASESSFQDTQHLGDVNEEAVVRSRSLDFADSISLSSGKSTNDVRHIAQNDTTQDQDLIHHSHKSASPKVANHKSVELESQQSDKSGDQENFHSLNQECNMLTSMKLADQKNMDLGTQRPKTSVTADIPHSLVENSITLISSEAVIKGKIDLESQQAQKWATGLPLGPPLPKSPSESWLKRTLPTISSRNSSSSQSSLGSWIYTSNGVSKTSSPDPKWEMIVKTSNVHHGCSRFSEELLGPIPES